MVWMQDIDFLAASESAGLEEVGMTEEEWLTYLDGEPDLSVVQEYISSKRQYSAAVYQQYNTNMKNKLFNSDEIVYVSRYSPVIIAELSQKRAVELCSSNVVVSMGCAQCSEVEQANESRSVSDMDDNQHANISLDLVNDLTNVDDVHRLFGNYGNGIKILNALEHLWFLM